MGSKRNWSKEEIEYLEDSWDKTSITGISKKLGRSINGVKFKAYRIGLGNHLHSGTSITLYELVCALGLPNAYGYTTNVWIKKGLPIKYKRCISKKYKVIDIDDFWEWAEKNKRILDFSKFEKNTLGKEPHWIDEKRKNDYISSMYKKTPWTKSEDNKLIWLLNMYKYTYFEISRRLMRTEGAIKKRCTLLKIKQRPLRAECSFWSKEEIETVLSLYDKGASFEEMSLEIGKSAQACRGIWERNAKNGSN